MHLIVEKIVFEAHFLRAKKMQKSCVVCCIFIYVVKHLDLCNHIKEIFSECSHSRHLQPSTSATSFGSKLAKPHITYAQVKTCTNSSKNSQVVPPTTHQVLLRCTRRGSMAQYNLFASVFKMVITRSLNQDMLFFIQP